MVDIGPFYTILVVVFMTMHHVYRGKNWTFCPCVVSLRHSSLFLFDFAACVLLLSAGMGIPRKVEAGAFDDLLSSQGFSAEKGSQNVSLKDMRDKDLEKTMDPVKLKVSGKCTFFNANFRCKDRRKAFFHVVHHEINGLSFMQRVIMLLSFPNFSCLLLTCFSMDGRILFECYCFFPLLLTNRS